MRFDHNALPDIDLGDVDLATTFVGKQISAPILVSSMTGGPSGSEAVNLARDPRTHNRLAGLVDAANTTSSTIRPIMTPMPSRAVSVFHQTSFSQKLGVVGQ